MTELYKEAIVEAKKLKEIAEIDARNKIIEAVAPYIKKIIATEAADTRQFLFGEEGDSGTGGEDMPLDAGAALEPEEPSVTPGDTATGAPISPSDGLVGMPMPDDEGKITVDFQQLFSMGGGGAEATPPPSATMEPSAPSAPEPSAPTEPAPVSPVGGTGPESTAPSADMGAAPTNTAATPAAPGAPASATGSITPPVPGTEEEEVPPPPVTESISNFTNEVRLIAEKIDYLYFRGNVSMLVKESLKSRLFTLCEKLDEMVNEDVISSKKARLAENKLEFLFMKLNEAEQSNTYRENKGAPMTTLREFAAKLFEEDALGPATADKATAHAEKVSGVAPGVDLFKEGSKEEELEETKKVDEDKDCMEEGKKEEMEESKEMKQMAEALLGEEAPASTAFGDGKVEGSAETKSDKVHNADALIKKAGAGITENAPASTAFGDGEKAKGAENTSPKVHKGEALVDEKGNNAILEFDEKELREAVAKLRKENLARRLSAVKKEAALKGTDKDGHLKPPSVDTGDQGSQKPAGGKNPALKNMDMKKESVVKEGMEEEGVSGGAPMAAGADSHPAMPMEEEVPMLGGEEGGKDEVELTFQIDVDDLEALLNGAAEKFEAEPVGGEAGEMPGSEMGGEIELVDDEPSEEMPELPGKEEGEEEMEEVVAESKKPAAKKPAASLNEAAVIAKAAKTVKTLQAQLNESKLLTAKALYVSKFAVREDLTSKQKQKIAEYFDKAKTLAEAKETYTKIKKILTEGSTSAKKLSGSASTPTSTGSAKLNESANEGQVEVSRWALLAGIKKNK